MLPSGVFSAKYEKDIAIVRTKTQWFLLIAGLILFFTVPLFLPDLRVMWLIKPVIITAIAVLGLHILTGLCGQISLGHNVFLIVGAYTSAILIGHLNWSPWATLPLCGVVAGLVGIVFGAPALRIKGFYLAVSTIAALFIIVWVIGLDQLYEWTKAGGSIPVGGLSIGGVDFTTAHYYYLAAVLLVLLIFFAKNIQRTRVGRTFIAIRDNDLAAQVMGINLFRYKLLAFFIGCFYAGIAGWLYVHFRASISCSDPIPILYASIWYLGMLVVGGMGSVTGALLGVGSLELLELVVVDKLAPALGLGPDIAGLVGTLAWAAVIVIFIIFEPRGLYHRWERFKSSYRLHPYSY